MEGQVSWIQSTGTVVGLVFDQPIPAEVTGVEVVLPHHLPGLVRLDVEKAIGCGGLNGAKRSR